YISEEGVSKGMASAKRLVPAPIDRETERKISEYAESFFREIGGQGIARIDFLLSKDKQRIYFNEINTIPGSLAFYLWKKKKVSFSKLVDRLIELGFERYNSRKNITNVFESNVLSGFEKVGGVKKI
ncbi:MAG: D-alanine--D-alanine ligase, partial [Deltaproteobacteria bacterium]